MQNELQQKIRPVRGPVFCSVQSKGYNRTVLVKKVSCQHSPLTSLATDIGCSYGHVLQKVAYTIAQKPLLNRNRKGHKLRYEQWEVHWSAARRRLRSQTLWKCSTALFAQSNRERPLAQRWFIDALVSSKNTTNILHFWPHCPAPGFLKTSTQCMHLADIRKSRPHVTLLSRFASSSLDSVKFWLSTTVHWSFLKYNGEVSTRG